MMLVAKPSASLFLCRKQQGNRIELQMQTVHNFDQDIKQALSGRKQFGMRVFILTISVLFFFVSRAQSQTPDSLLKSLSEKMPFEKVYLHVDKDVYLPGETIWFKAYILSNNKPSLISTSLCVEWMNDSGHVIEKKVYPVINSAAAGSFDIPRQIKPMQTTVRAYTRNMMRMGNDAVMLRRIPIINPSAENKPVILQREAQVNFMPEGGDMIATVSNRIACKVTDQWGYPLSCEAIVSDENGAEVARFKTIHDGMGSFSLVPRPGASYFAQCIPAGAAPVQVKLPAVRPTGTVIQVNKVDGVSYVELNSETVVDPGMRPGKLLGVMENTVVFSIPLPPEARKVKSKLPLADLPTGILQLTVFNTNDQPLAERLVFVHNGDFKAGGNLRTDTVGLAARQKNSYSFELADSLNGTFSVSVTDADHVIASGNTEQIASGLLLSGELTGYIHDPAYYLESNDEEHLMHTDLLMLTHGWRRFRWEDIIAGRVPSSARPSESYIGFSGLLYKNDGITAYGETELSVFVRTKDGGSRMSILPVAKDGSFNISDLIFEDTATLYFQLTAGKNRKPLISAANLSVQDYFTLRSPLFQPPLRSWLKEDAPDKVKALYGTLYSNEFNEKALTLGEVKVAARSKSPRQLVEEKYIRSSIFNSYSTKTFDLLNDQVAANTTTNIFEFLKGRLSSVTISGSNGNYFLNFRNTMSLMGGLIPMDLYLNEFPATSLQISTIPVNQVALVKVYPQGFIGGVAGSPGGALAVYTKAGSDLYNIPGLDQSVRIPLPGYSPAKEFYSPDYSSARPTERDTRTTLYWNPYLRTDPGQPGFRFSFFNSDRSKRLKVVLEGMTEDGRLLHMEKMIEAP